MSAQTHLPLLDVSSVLEYGSPTPLSTHWIPLHELIAHWMDAQTLLEPVSVAPLLTAAGHALFALSHETRALRLWTQAGRQQAQQGLPALVIGQRRQQVVRHVQEATHHWSRAAFALDTLLPNDLDASVLARARQLSRIARTQQERLWALTEEVQAEQIGASSQDQGNVKHLLARCAIGDRILTVAAPCQDDSTRERKES